MNQTRKETQKKYADKNREMVNEKSKLLNRERGKAYAETFRKKHPGRVEEIKKKWFSKNYKPRPITNKSMHAKASIAKGKRFEKHLLNDIRENLDANAYITPGSGSGLQKNDIIIPAFKIEVEAKNAKKFSLMTNWNQVERQKTPYNKVILIARHPDYAEFEKSLVIMDYNDWKEMLLERVESGEVEETLSFQKKNSLERLKSSIANVKKEFNFDV